MRAASWLLVMVSPATATILAQPVAVEPAAAIRQLHQTMIKPASDAIFNVGREAPKNDEEWTAVASAGATLAASGTRLLMLGSHARVRGKWMTLCRQLAAAGRTARKAAEARNLSAVIRASDRLVIVCETCHAPYRNQGHR